MAPVAYRPADEADVTALAELFNASNRADGIPQVLDATELAEELSSERTSIATDTLVAVDGGVPVGVVYTVYIPSETVHERCFVFGTVAPDRRAEGIGRELMAWGIEHGTALLRSTERDLPRRIVVDAYEQRTADQQMFTRLGFRPVRWFEELRRPLGDESPAIQVDGVSIIPWPDDRDEELLGVRNAAFADHWGTTPITPAVWQADIHGYGARTDLSFVGVDGEGKVVAVCANGRFEADDDVTGRRDGWIMTLGTLAEWRGRGVASALIAASLGAFAAADLTHAALGVDSDSPTGAARLYRSLGFETATRSTMFFLDV